MCMCVCVACTSVAAAAASGLAAILNATTPLFSIVLARLLTDDERLTAGRVGGVLLGLGGMYLLHRLDDRLDVQRRLDA